MRNMIRRAAVILMAFVMMLTMMPFVAFDSLALSGEEVTVGDYTYRIYDNPDGIRVWMTKYTGSATQIIVPASVTVYGKKYDNFMIMDNAFAGNTTLQKVAIPAACDGISSNAFAGCTSLTEVAIEYGDVHLGSNAFAGCPKLKTYRINGAASDDDVWDSGIGRDSDGNVYENVTVYTSAGSHVAKAIGANDGTEADTINGKSKANGNGNCINVVIQDNPYADHTVKPTDGESTDKDTKGEDGTAYGKGASESVVDAAITKYAKETDPKGTIFGLLQARLSKATKNSLTLQWKKVSGAKKYVVYGNACGSKNKMKKLVSKTTKTKMVFKKVAGKKVTKGKYYKFMVVAFDKNNKVLSTSVIVYAATTGGKVGNDKSVTTKAKNNKVTVKKGKTFKLAAKAVPQSKKLKVSKYRVIKYESSNKSIATVSAKGVINGKKKGACYVYAYAQNGVFKKVKVTVK